MVVALVAIGLGYFTGDSHWSFVGLFFLFLLGVYVFTNQIQYEVGTTKNTSYSYTNSTLTSTSEVLVNNYSTYQDQYTRWFGVLLSISSAFGMFFILYNLFEKRE